MLTASPARPAGLASAAAAALAGINPLVVSDIPMTHPALAPAVRELAGLTGDRVPLPYALLLPPGSSPRDTFDPNYDVGLDPREGFPYSAHEAEDHYQWAREHGLADDADEHPSDYADDEYDPRDVADLSEQGEPVEDAYPHDWDDGSLDSLAGPE